MLPAREIARFVSVFALVARTFQGGQRESNRVVKSRPKAPRVARKSGRVVGSRLDHPPTLLTARHPVGFAFSIYTKDSGLRYSSSLRPWKSMVECCPFFVNLAFIPMVVQKKPRRGSSGDPAGAHIFHFPAPSRHPLLCTLSSFCLQVKNKMVVHMDARSKEILALKRENAELRARVEQLEGMMALGGVGPESGALIDLRGGTVSPRGGTSASSKSSSSRTATSTSPGPKSPPPVPPRPARSPLPVV